MPAPAAPGVAKLYNSSVLGLATALAEFPYIDGRDFLAEARSPTCGSNIKIGIDCSLDGSISEIGIAVSACAIGQASAALMVRSMIGAHSGQPAAQLAKITAWLTGEASLPDITSFDLIAHARAYPARHGAILLPWRAAADALSKV